jgi:23S rRNA pseudouridine1911/1915/1917 synthase
LGDALYGGAMACAGAPVARSLLHAFKLTVPHPRSGGPLRLEAPAPADFAPFLAKL